MFILIVNITFNDSISKEIFIKKFKILQEYCLNYERDFLLQYEYAVSDTNSNMIVVIEKYNNKENYLNIHRKSNKFLNFKKQIKNLDITISGNSYIL